ncbi:cold-shock protein [Bradyrhizobium sp. Cp5.3]|uniref:cold-shock protein n=1 Tax=Bradyrhizobium sp. Cp5.3 TaxID=443598 RepID=UPI000414DD56|nr:cold shock domain-containing protein [Bradyrhizobium sp. Cp5.3]
MSFGIIKKWIDDRGFGFIKPDERGPDVFIHVKMLPRGSAHPIEGDRVRYEVGTDDRSGRSCAVNVQIL